MLVERLSIPEILRIRPARFGDSRGYFSEVYSVRTFRDLLGGVDFVQDNEASSEAVGTLRGLHFRRRPRAQGKLIRVIKGAIFDVAVDIRWASPTYGRYAHDTEQAGITSRQRLDGPVAAFRSSIFSGLRKVPTDKNADATIVG
ncbi:dTDP-4-dehydrorhamnose 3,5-epimerase family protein [Labrys neptuniae]